jgi:hypothetical protein
LVRTAYRVNLYPEDTWSRGEVTYTRPRCAGGSVTATITSDANLFTRPQTVSAAGRHVTFSPSETVELTVPLRPRNDVCRVVFAVAPTAVPADVLPESNDLRVLGAHFLSFRYNAP